MTDNSKNRPTNRATQTALVQAGRNPHDQFGFVNTPLFRGSTVLFKTYADLQAQEQRYLYGRAGNPTTEGVEAIVTELEGAFRTKLVPSGLAAITVALLSCLKTGDDILITDSAYEPTRSFAEGFLKNMGITARYYDPRIGAGLADLMQSNTRAVFAESPGSLTFELQDLPALAEAAHAGGARLIVDNTWASPLYLKPLQLGADIVVHAATKMFSGHSDAFGGTISATSDAWPDVERARTQLGFFTSADDAYLIARGLRTLSLRMSEHEKRAIDVATWLEAQEGVSAVFHPALPSHPDHAIWQRDFTGSGSLFALLMKPASQDAIAAFLDHLELFGIGFSWGGYESLCIPARLSKNRTAIPWAREGNLFRLHIGFEDMADIKADLSAAIGRYLSAR